MPGQVVTAGKAFTTLRAGEEFGALVELLVCPEALWPAEALPAVWALTWPHP